MRKIIVLFLSLLFVVFYSASTQSQQVIILHELTGGIRGIYGLENEELVIGGKITVYRDAIELRSLGTGISSEEKARMIAQIKGNDPDTRKGLLLIAVNNNAVLSGIIDDKGATLILGEYKRYSFEATCDVNANKYSWLTVKCTLNVFDRKTSTFRPNNIILTLG